MIRRLPDRARSVTRSCDSGARASSMSAVPRTARGAAEAAAGATTMSTAIAERQRRTGYGIGFAGFAPPDFVNELLVVVREAFAQMTSTITSPSAGRFA